MYELYITPRSPFARRIRLILRRLQIAYTEKPTDVFRPDPEFLLRNPLALVPVLTLPNGTHLPDSNTILEYLAETHPGQVWPTDPAERLSVRQASTWATGIMTACVAHYLEKQHPSPDSACIHEYETNIQNTLHALNQAACLRADRLNQACWDLGVALEYIDLRVPETQWKKEFYRLESILLACQKNPDFVKTTPPPA